VTRPVAPAMQPLTGAGPGVDVYAGTTVGKLSPAVAADPPRVYVPNSVSNTVDVIDPTTFRVIDHFPVGATPQHVVPSYDLSTLYVNDNKGNTLTPRGLAESASSHSPPQTASKKTAVRPALKLAYTISAGRRSICAPPKARRPVKRASTNTER